MFKYLKSSLSDWRTWWNAPITKEDRRIGAVLGAIGGCIMGFVLRIVVGPIPAPWQEFAAWSGAALVLFAFLGWIFPKPVLLIVAPFVKILEGI